MKLKTFINCTLCIVALGFLFALTSCGDTNGPSGDSDTKIVSFTFADFTPAVVGTINHTAKTVALKVPPMTNKQYLVPTIVLPAGATISPASGIQQNFNIPVQYTVTAKDGTTAIYTVTVTEDNTSVNPIVLSGTYSDNTDLPNVRQGVDYIINERIYISGSSLLTIQPGVTIEFTSASAGITIEGDAGFKIAGTAANPVIFKGAAGNPNKASWSGIYLLSNRQDNVWQYLQIINAGLEADYDAAVKLDGSASLTMENCSISGSGQYGIWLEDNTKLKKYDYNVISGCNNAPIYCSNFVQASPLTQNSTFNDNIKKYIEIESFSNIESDLTIRDLGVSYLVKGIYVVASAVTIEAGVEIISKYDGIFRVDEASRIVANGTSAKPIIFTTEDKYPGQWHGIEIYSQQNNSFANCIIENAGQSETSNLILWNGKVDLNNVSIKNSANWGVNYNSGSTITHNGVTFTNNANGNVYYYDDGTVTETLP
ncbi:MAG: right-handed parallel beta-helix repeat-containing protein [bacterium]